MTLHIGMLLYPALTQLDLTGPFELFARIPDATVHTVWKTTDPVRADSGLTLVPSTTLEACPPLDLVFVPGGRGQIPVMQDEGVLRFVRDHGERAKWVTSVCTGSLILGAAGLLKGYRATSHWGFRELLPMFGAELADGRVVVDRNRITAGGVTAGIDFGLTILAETAGEGRAKAAQLEIEYDPAPPFACGHPKTADAHTVQAVRAAIEERFQQRKTQIRAMTEA
ncbi:MAG: DJ-1/PfpI family protein [Labilithrix sp.]